MALDNEQLKNINNIISEVENRTRGINYESPITFKRAMPVVKLVEAAQFLDVELSKVEAQNEQYLQRIEKLEAQAENYETSRALSWMQPVRHYQSMPNGSVLIVTQTSECGNYTLEFNPGFRPHITIMTCVQVERMGIEPEAFFDFEKARTFCARIEILRKQFEEQEAKNDGDNPIESAGSTS